MKRVVDLVFICALSLAAAPAHGQGTVTLGNNRDTAITNALTLMRVVAGSTFRVALYYMPDQPVAPTPEEIELSGIQVGASGNIQPAAGFYAAGTRTTPNTTMPGGWAWFQVRAWETAFGSTYEQARDNPNPIGGRGACLGTSNIILVKTGDARFSATLPASLVQFGLQSFTVCAVPEPGFVMLTAGGIMTLLLLRRHRLRRT